MRLTTFLLIITFSISGYASTILKDVTNDGLEDKITISQIGKSQTSLLTIKSQDKNHNFHTILKKKIARGEHFEIYDVTVDSANSLYKEEDEVSFTIDYKNENALILETSKDGYLSRYKLYFIYDKKSKKFMLDRTYYLSFNNVCFHELLSIYLLKPKKLQNVDLENFDSKSIYSYLYKNIFYALERFNGEKIKSKEATQMYDKLMDGSIKNMETCGCEELRYDISCTAEKYYFKNDITFTNNIAYFLERSGKYSHAVYFLERIIEQHPNRTVAYYNLGDAYWGDGNKEKAKEAYRKYIELMKKAGKEKRIPQKVKDRAK
jgi:tetratricopeptide (TPR) repeat protein